MSEYTRNGYTYENNKRKHIPNSGKTHMLREIQSDSLKLYQKEEKKRE